MVYALLLKIPRSNKWLLNTKYQVIVTRILF